MFYEVNKQTKKADYFIKEKATYVIAEPPPQNNPYMKPDWWVINQVNIKVKPSLTTVYPNKYEVRLYKLSDEEIKVPFDPSVDPGLNFR